MFFIDKPYVSDFFKQTLRDHTIPVVNTEASQALNSDKQATWLSEQEAIEYAKNIQLLKVYTNSENTIGWIAKHLPQSALANTIDQFKDKLVFRQLTQPLFPD